MYMYQNFYSMAYAIKQVKTTLSYDLYPVGDQCQWYGGSVIMWADQRPRLQCQCSEEGQAGEGPHVPLQQGENPDDPQS